MTEPRRGRRDNGLVAAEYAPAGDVDPRVGEHLLDVLALDGIAAYLRPSSDLHPVTRTATLPDRPTDRLYVDRVHLATARDYLARLAADAGEPAASEAEDRAWSEIVAGFAAEAVPPVRPWPAAEDLPETPAAASAVLPDEGPTITTRSVAEDEPATLLDGLDTFG